MTNSWRMEKVLGQVISLRLFFLSSLLILNIAGIKWETGGIKTKINPIIERNMWCEWIPGRICIHWCLPLFLLEMRKRRWWLRILRGPSFTFTNGPIILPSQSHFLRLIIIPYIILHPGFIGTSGTFPSFPVLCCHGNREIRFYFSPMKMSRVSCTILLMPA